MRVGGVYRPHYAWCMYYAAAQAKALGHKAMTVIEFGVAGGTGLMRLCRLREDTQKALGIEIILVGFDSGAGLPQSTDPRDTLYAWPAGSFRMDRGALEARIAGQAHLVLGDVAETVILWEPEARAPLGAVMFDLDYFTSTSAALPILTKKNLLPRVWCYFDDVCTGPEEAMTDRLGERAAINQFNDDPERAVHNDYLSRAFTFKGLAPEGWHQQIYLYHRLDHPDYNLCLVGAERDQLKLVNT